MKKFLFSLIIIVSLSSIEALAQTNIFPSSGNVGIGTITPDANSILHIKGVHANTNAMFELPAASNGNNTGNIVLKTWVSEPEISWEGTGIGANINNWGLKRYNNSLSSSYIRFIPHPTVGYMLFSTITGSGMKHDNVMAIVNNMVGIGTTSPSRKLEVISETNNIAYFRDNSTASEVVFRGNPTNTIFDFGNRPLQVQFNSAPSFTLNTLGNMGIGTVSPTEKLEVNGNIQLSGTIKYGNGGVRTEYRNNAGLQGNAGAMSGFFETVAPQNFPKDDNSWWHLIDSRHSNAANNYAMQIAGSFFDQKLYFRKTNSNSTETWKEFVAVDINGKISLDNDVAALKKSVTIGSYVYGGAIRFNANSAVANNRNLELGNSDNNGIFYPSIVLNAENGNVGIGTSNPENSEGWHKVLDVYGSSHSKILATTASVQTGIWSHSTGFYNSPAGGIFGTKTNHPLSFITNGTNKLLITNNGNVGIGTINPTAKLEIYNGSVLVNTPRTSTGSIIPIAVGTQYYTGIPTKGLAGLYHIESGTSGFGQSGGLCFYTSSDDILPTEKVRITNNGNVGIGTTDTKGYKLAVAGEMIAERVVVKLTGNWPDYVFNAKYDLRPLEQVEQFINQNSHLPEVPSAQEVSDKGIDVGAMNAKLLQKVEELTLYLIEQNKEIKMQNKENKMQNNEIENLKKELESIKDKK